MKNNTNSKVEQLAHNKSEKKSFRFLNKSMLFLLLIPALVWQCKKDDFEGEIVGMCPEVISTNPYHEEINVATAIIVKAHFNEKMDPQTINVSTFILTDGTNQINGTVTYSDSTASFYPNNYLSNNTEYTATIKKGAQNPLGSALREDYVWTFTTGNQTNPNATPQGGIDLNSAAAFAVLSGSGVTNTGPTVVTGDLGTSPNGTVNGFPPGIIVGNIHAADPVAAQAKLDITTAYNDAQGRSTGAVSLPGNLSGLTITPGLYKNSSSVMLSAGSVTLDAQGDINAIFIFQMGSTLTTGSGTSIILAGGADANNIYWAVGSSATLGTNSDFVGTILADQSISLNTGASLTGRALTRIGAVTLDNNAVTLP